MDLRNFGVSKVSGFLPEKFPLTSLPQEYYKPWESLIQNLPALNTTRQLRSHVNKLQLLSTEYLESEEQYRRAYQILTFLAQSYVWGEEPAVNRLPENVAKPLLEVSDELRIPPLSTYASLCLWNFKPIIPIETDEDMWDLDNFSVINTFTGSIDESWFYLVSIFFEFKGAIAIQTGLEAIDCVNKRDTRGLINALQCLAEAVDHLGSVLMRMEDMCDPHVFYFRIRPFLAGWKNMSDLGLSKDGVIYGNETKGRLYSGGSNGQSSLIQFLDTILEIKHFSTGERPLPHEAEDETKKSENSFMNDMKNYMPGLHRDFLNNLEERTNIRDYVSAHKDKNAELALSYDACLAMMKSFRDKHIQIVTRYIILQAKKSNKMGSDSTIRSGLAKSKKKGLEERGTGGTALLPFLKQCRDETGDPAAGNWGKRILSDGVMRLKFSKSNAINED